MKKIILVTILILGCSTYASAQRNIKGYRASFSTGATAGIGDYGDDAIELSTSHGYQFNPYIFLGAGVAVSYHKDWETVFVPVFVDFKVNFINQKVTPFFGLKTGYSAYDATGAYVNPSMGVSFGIGRKASLDLSIGYTLQVMDDMETISSYGYYRYYSDYSSENVEGITFRIGFSF